MVVPTPAIGQGFLDQFSYEGLGLSAVSVELGGIASDRLTTELTGAVRLDFGYFGPRIRVLGGVSYFKGTFTNDQISTFENRLLEIIDNPGGATVNVGTITLASYQAEFDLQYVFVPDRRVRPYAGLGLALIIRDGDGDAIQGTFVEDALDTFTAGITGSLGVEVVILDWVAALADARGLLSSELRALSARLGVKFLIPRGAW